jgi:hypothetical protein
MQVPFVRTKSGLTVFVSDGTPINIQEGHVNFGKINSGLLNGTIAENELQDLIDEQKTVSVWSQGKIQFDGEKTTFDGFQLHQSLAIRLQAIIDAGESLEVMEKFIANLYENPSLNSVDQLYGFLDANDLPITDDGCFFAYKKVRYDFRDLHTGVFDNSVGAKPTMARHQVDDDKTRTCSRGLHVASFSYMAHYGGQGKTDLDDVIVVCKINPRDVVSVPVDYNNAKMRVATYEVVSVIPRGEDDPLFEGFMTNASATRIGELITRFRAMDEFKTAKFESDLCEDLTDKEIEDLAFKVFTNFKVAVLGKSIEEVTREFLDEKFYSFTMKELIEHVINHS